MRTIDDLGDLRGKRVLLRSDLNVPLEDGQVADDGRIRASVATISRLSDAGARVIVMAHLGRPGGSPDPRFSLRPVFERLAALLPGRDVRFADDPAGPSAKAAVEALPDAGVALLENLRFDPRETSKDDAERGAFADELAALADAFVSDGFGVVHRKQASVYDIAQRLPHAAGDLVLAEVRAFAKVLDEPQRPYVVVLGGSKVSDKLAIIDNLLGKADTILVGGGMLFTFLAAAGHKVAGSLLEEDQIPVVQDYLKRAADAGTEFVVPTDVVVAAKFAADADHETVSADAIESSSFGTQGIGLDIGPDSAKAFAERIQAAKTVFWNGPMGVFEFEAFS